MALDRKKFPVTALLLALFALLGASPARAHVGSPDVYAEAEAGPYKLFVTVRPPQVIPGVAEIEVRCATPGVTRMEVTPMPLTGEAAKHPPVPDVMQQPSKDPQFYTGHLWIMTTGSWQVRFTVNGAQGSGVVSIPLPATALTTLRMQPALGGFLLLLCALLVLGLIGIVGAAALEALLPPGSAPAARNRMKSRLAMGITAAALATLLLGGNLWWKAEAKSYAGNVYKPLQMKATLAPGNVMDLKLSDPGWLKQRKLDDFVPDHDHLMHLYVIREPQMDVVFHLHPEQVGPGDFKLPLPTMPAGSYRLYADVVHANGFPETMVASATVPFISGRQLGRDEAEGTGAPINTPDYKATTFRLADGYSMVWDRPRELHACAAQAFKFTLLNASGHPPADMALYMGMVGHAAFVDTDGSVFAHVHPSGTPSMAAMDLAAQQNGSGAMQMPGMEAMPGMASTIPNTVEFPYGFPKPGEYRIFVQMKHGKDVETGFFDALVQ
jgi:hypothetical protein